MEIKMFLIVNLDIILCLKVLSVSGNCPLNSYILEDRSACYWLSAYSQSYNLSKTVCKSNNLQLAIIPNKQVNDQLSTYITNHVNSDRSDKIWIGVNDMETESVYKNSDGSKISWSNWHNSTGPSKEPNDLNNPGIAAQDCVCIDKNGEWFDETCTRTYRALCFKLLGDCLQNGAIVGDRTACYWLSASSQNYYLSKTVCESNTLQLAIVPNNQVNDQLSTYITNQLNSKDSDKVWIGVNDMETESVYKNSDGSNISWSNWHNSTGFNKEPNDLNNPGVPSQDCVCIDKKGEWFDETCTKMYRALCFKLLATTTSTTSTITTTTATSNLTSLMQATMMQSPTSFVPKDKFLIPVIITVSIIFILVFTNAAICIARRIGCKKSKKINSPSSGLNQKNIKRNNQHNFGIDSEMDIKKDDVYYSYANYSPDYYNTCVEETIEGEYEVPNKQDDKEYQIYSHNDIDETPYELPVMNPYQNIINVETFDITNEENTYMTMETG